MRSTQSLSEKLVLFSPLLPPPSSCPFFCRSSPEFICCPTEHQAFTFSFLDTILPKIFFQLVFHCLLFLWYWVWIQAKPSLFARQMLYHFSMLSSPFRFSYFSDRVLSFCPEPALEPQSYSLHLPSSWNYRCVNWGTSKGTPVLLLYLLISLWNN
jgi:hypothetical protein